MHRACGVHSRRWLPWGCCFTPTGCHLQCCPHPHKWALPSPFDSVQALADAAKTPLLPGMNIANAHPPFAAVSGVCRVGGLRGIAVACLAAANRHTAVATSDGRVFSWGSNLQGQLGYGTSDSASNATPRVVEVMKVGGPSTADRPLHDCRSQEWAEGPLVQPHSCWSLPFRSLEAVIEPRPPLFAPRDGRIGSKCCVQGMAATKGHLEGHSSRKRQAARPLQYITPCCSPAECQRMPRMFIWVERCQSGSACWLRSSQVPLDPFRPEQGATAVFILASMA